MLTIPSVPLAIGCVFGAAIELLVVCVLVDLLAPSEMLNHKTNYGIMFHINRYVSHAFLPDALPAFLSN